MVGGVAVIGLLVDSVASSGSTAAATGCSKNGSNSSAVAVAGAAKSADAVGRVFVVSVGTKKGSTSSNIWLVKISGKTSETVDSIGLLAHESVPISFASHTRAKLALGFL